MSDDLEKIAEVVYRIDENVKNIKDVTHDQETRVRKLEVWKTGHETEHGISRRNIKVLYGIAVSSFSGFLVFIFNVIWGVI